MKTFKALRIKPKSLFHLGEVGVGIERVAEIPHSDTIFSGICNCYAILRGKDELEALLKKFKEKPPFLVSSAFPLLILPDGKSIFFLPKPKVFFKFKNYEDAKKFEKAIYVSVDAFIKGSIELLMENKELEVIGNFMVTHEEFDVIDENYGGKIGVGMGIVAGNRLDKPTLKSKLYYRGVASYPENMQLYVLFKGGIGKDVEASIRLLCEEGLGGERSIGFGRFGFKFCELNLPNADNTGVLMTLSLYHPTFEEFIEFKKKPQYLNYRLVKRAGYAFSPFFANKGLLKRWVRMFVEGSTFPKIDGKDVYGALVKVLEKEGFTAHDVYRYGYAFSLGLGKNWVEK